MYLFHVALDVQQAALVSASSCIGVMQQLNWCHAASCIGVMLHWCQSAAALVICILFKYLHATCPK
jgi:hypothetical protein